jgi:hypothetical protein
LLGCVFACVCSCCCLHTPLCRSPLFLHPIWNNAWGYQLRHEPRPANWAVGRPMVASGWNGVWLPVNSNPTLNQDYIRALLVGPELGSGGWDLLLPQSAQPGSLWPDDSENVVVGFGVGCETMSPSELHMQMHRSSRFGRVCSGLQWLSPLPACLEAIAVCAWVVVA